MPVALAALGALVVSLDASVNIAFPAMAAAFGVGPVAIRWVIVCYVLTYALTSFVAGVLADRRGPAPVFAAGLWISALAFTAYLAVGGFGALLAARVVQGVGGGLVYGTAPALVTLALPRERHGRGLGRLALGLGTGLAVGPLIGGALVEAFGWRAVFLYRAPLAAVLGVVAAMGLPPGRRGGVWRLPPRREWLRAPVLTALGLAALANGSQFAVWLLAPFYLVSVLGLSPAVGGLFFMLTPLATAALAPVAGRLTDRVGPRAPMALGLAAESLGLLAIGTFDAGTPRLAVGAGLALVGAGIGLFQVPNLARVMAAFPPARQGAAGGLAFMSRTLGVVGGVEVIGAIFGARARAGGWQDGFGAGFAAAGTVCALAALIAAVSTRRAEYHDGAGNDPGAAGRATASPTSTASTTPEEPR
ncbi:MAG TPA: MFS transporter [Methylomirabilota bacterium]|nr:MFS transporter [Methylomirabilota bacterium]